MGKKRADKATSPTPTGTIVPQAVAETAGTAPMAGDVRRAARPLAAGGPDLPAAYPVLLAAIKSRIRAAQVKAALSVNRELIELYWSIGHDIAKRQRDEKWGSSVVQRLSTDLRAEFPGLAGFSPQNIWHMRSFYLAWTQDTVNLQQPVGDLQDVDGKNLPQPVREIPWGHNLQLIAKLPTPAQRLWYARQTIHHGWSRAVLVHQIESDLYGRQAKALTNFDRTLPAPDSDLVRQLLKDPYNFDFLAMGADIEERQLERALLDHIRQFLLELGSGFAFIGSQYHIEVAGRDYYLDLFFYHIHLRRFIVIDLKVEEFQPEFAGKMNFYLSSVDTQYRTAQDGQSIGILLCKSKDAVTVEYALRDTAKPIGVAEYRLGQPLPADVRAALPTAEQLQAEMEKATAEPHRTKPADEPTEAAD